jgi:hypothetical protein
LPVSRPPGDDLPASRARGLRQRHLVGAAAQGRPEGAAGRESQPGLIWSLLHEPAWFGGIAAVTVGFLLQATALGSGQLSVVEPILVLELPATLLLATRVFHSRLHRREWGSAAAMAAGLAAMLYALSPSGGRPEAVRWYTWVAGIGVNLAFVADQHLLPGNSRAGIKLAVVRDDRDGDCRDVPPPVRAQRGRLVAVQPGLTLTDPIVSIPWGVLVFREQVRTGWFLAATVAGGLVLAGAVLVLGRSPLLSGESGRKEQPDSTDEHPARASSRSGER